jgi:hypothetical protein
MVTSSLKGGNRLQERLKEYMRKVKSSEVVNVGFLAGATYPDGTPVPLVAALNEFGVPSHNQPPRPFMRNMIAKEQGHWGEDTATLLKSTDYDAEKTLDLMGFQIEGEMRQSIIDTNSPKLAESTIKARLAKYKNKERTPTIDKPLIDTTHMINTVAHEVKLE